MEGQWALKSKTLTNLSVEQVVDCDGMQKPDTYVSFSTSNPISHSHTYFCRAQADCGVYGGWPFLSFQYLMQQVNSLCFPFITMSNE